MGRGSDVIQDDAYGHDSGHQSRRGRRETQRKMRDWVGEIDYELLEDYDDSDALDDIPVFERLRSRRRNAHES